MDSETLDRLRKPGGYWYVATPYSDYPEGLDAAYGMACRVTGALLRLGVVAFSPIAHGHGIPRELGLGTSAAAWAKINDEMMHSSCGLVVVRMYGWRMSRGVQTEISAFIRRRQPIEHVEPFDVIVAAQALAQDGAL
jgi:hypothetical protein